MSENREVEVPFSEKSRRRVAIETTEAIFAFGSTFHGAHCMAIVAFLLPLLGHIYLLAFFGGL